MDESRGRVQCTRYNKRRETSIILPLCVCVYLSNCAQSRNPSLSSQSLYVTRMGTYFQRGIHDGVCMYCVWVCFYVFI